MARETIDPNHVELKALLADMLDRDEAITARAVAKLHSTMHNASAYTRNVERRVLLEEAQAKQQEVRQFVGRVKRDGSKAAAEKLQSALGRIHALEADEAARVASHLAMIRAMMELGGTAKLLTFYKSYADIRDRLHRQGALPKSAVGAELLPFVV
jgi:hypothetical protein